MIASYWTQEPSAQARRISFGPLLEEVGRQGQLDLLRLAGLRVGQRGVAAARARAGTCPLRSPMVTA